MSLSYSKRMVDVLKGILKSSALLITFLIISFLTAFKNLSLQLKCISDNVIQTGRVYVKNERKFEMKVEKLQFCYRLLTRNNICFIYIASFILWMHSELDELSNKDK